MSLPHLLLWPVLLTLTQLAGEHDGCRRCDHRGVLACPAHTAELLAHEHEVLFCSIAARCEQCLGALLIDCKHCKGGPDDHLIAERQAEVADWMAIAPMAKYLERHVPAVETEHFQLVVDTGPLKRGKKTIDGHLIMHRVAHDVIEVARLIGEHFQLKGSESRAAHQVEGDTSSANEFQHEYSSKMRMWVWKNAEDHRRVMLQFLGSSSTGDFKLLGRRPTFSVWTEGQFTTEPGVRRLFSHTAPHMLLSNLYSALWTGDTGGGWFDAGSAHWYEYKLHDLSVNYCIEESTLPLDFNGGVWRAPIRRWLKKESKPFLPTLLRKNTGAMELPEQAICWSFYDWLVAEHVEVLPDLQRGLKAKRPSRELLKEALGLPILVIEQAWRDWVNATYPMQGDKPRRSRPKKKG